MKNKFLLCALCLLLITLSSCSKGELFLIEDSKSNSYIFLDKEHSQIEKKAALEFQKYVDKSTGIILPIFDQKKENKIAVEIKVSSDIYKNSIKFIVDKNKLSILGGSPKYLLYSVYEFLEKYLNIRFYSPKVEKIPILKNVSIPKNLSYEYTTKVNIRTVHSKLFYGNKDFADKHKVTYEAFPYYVPDARVHTFNRFLPPDKYFKTNPEYYAFRNGRRVPTQLCLSNDEVYKIIKQEVKKRFEKYPQSSVISVSTNDNTQYCLCKDCSQIEKEEGSQSGAVIRLVNRIAKDFPDKTISTLAYQYTRKAPNTPAAKNVLITLCSIECDRSAPIEEKCKDFSDDLMGWKKINANLRIWDYTTQFTNFLAPFPNIHTIKPNIDFFVNNNAKWIFEQHSNDISELFELRSYLMAKLLWNPNLQTDDIINDFISGYYEEAGVYIKKYIDLIHEKILEDENFFLFLYGQPSSAFESFLSKENLEQYNYFFDKAEQAVIDKPDVLKRVLFARLSTIYATMEACRANISDEYSFDNIEYVSNLIDKFKNICKDNFVKWMNETGFSVSEYLDMYNDNIQRSKLVNLAKNKSVLSNTKPKKYANEDPMTLTDGIFGGGNFGDNWLGYEGEDLDVVIDLGKNQKISNISVKFLQVVNHIVFLPKEVYYYSSYDGKKYKLIGKIDNPKPLNKKSKNNVTHNFLLKFKPLRVRYVKIVAKSLKKAPIWHHGADLPSWVFADEVVVN